MRGMDWPVTLRERLLVVSDLGDLTKTLRDRYPQYEVLSAPTFLAGIATLASDAARGVLVGVDPTCRKFNAAVAGLRKAAGPEARVILCSPPSAEPVARAALGSGADDYLIYPPEGRELDQALDIRPHGRQSPEPAPPEITPTWEEINALASVLSEIGGNLRSTLERLCRLIADALRTSFVRIAVQDTSATLGDPGTEAVLSEAITAGGRTLGRILVGPRQRSPYSTGEVEKLRHYARLSAHLIEAAEQQQHWQSLAMIDEATQLPNRRYLMHALEAVLRRAATERFRVTVLLFDLDGFKHFNDAYGHSAGDEVIRETGKLFRKHCRQHDVVARYAGDEFVVVFWDAEEPRIAGSKHPTDALAVLRRVKRALESHEFPKLGPEAVGRITISAGLASFPWDARDAQSLIDKADQAMLQAKRAGKNRVFLVGSEGEAAEDITPPAQTSSG